MFAPDRTPLVAGGGHRLAVGLHLITLENARDATRLVRAERGRLRSAALSLMSLLLSALVSLYLARTIVEPILRDLTRAAVRVHQGRGREVIVPAPWRVGVTRLACWRARCRT